MTDRIDRIAESIVASDFPGKYSNADEEERYADELSRTVAEHFSNGRLESPVVRYSLEISPKRFLGRGAKGEQRKSYQIEVVLTYADLASPEDLPNERERTTVSYGTGGEAILDMPGNPVIVIVGDSSEDWCAGEKFFQDTFRHEMMHVLDHIAYPYHFNSDEAYGHVSRKEKKRNLGPAFPCGEEDVFDDRFAEYFTCDNEIREYRGDLRQELLDRCERNGMSWQEAVSEIKSALKDKASFRSYAETVKGNLSPFAMLYHLCFGNTVRSGKKAAFRLLDGLRET